MIRYHTTLLIVQVASIIARNYFRFLSTYLRLVEIYGAFESSSSTFISFDDSKPFLFDCLHWNGKCKSQDNPSNHVEWLTDTKHDRLRVHGPVKNPCLSLLSIMH